MREFCYNCRKAKVTCYCALLRPFESGPRFVILMHPREWRNSVGTGRMVRLSITNSLLIQGHEFSRDEQVNALISDPAHHAVVLYPGREALDLSTCSSEAAAAFTPPGKRLVVFVIDGTWAIARGMINRSPNLKALPQLRFTPEARSGYQIREQPDDHCLSTLEAVHWMIERFDRLGTHPAPADRAHDGLLRIFDHMVRQQIDFEEGKQQRTEGPRLPSRPTRVV